MQQEISKAPTPSELCTRRLCVTGTFVSVCSCVNSECPLAQSIGIHSVSGLRILHCGHLTSLSKHYMMICAYACRRVIGPACSRRPHAPRASMASHVAMGLPQIRSTSGRTMTAAQAESAVASEVRLASGGCAGKGRPPPGSPLEHAFVVVNAMG